MARAARRTGARRTLLLDLDGTLAPIAPTPEEARVPPSTLRLLRELLRREWTVAVVSGRPSSQVRRLVPVRGIRVFGSHGLEGSWDGRAPVRVDPALKRRMARLARDGEALANGTPGARLEVKPVGIAFHDRSVRASALGVWRRRLRRWLAEKDLRGFEALPGRRVLEIRPEGIHKGLVARGLLEGDPGRRRDDSLVAIGDDRTDEDLFRELAGRGLAVRVGRAGIRTAAPVRLPSPASVARFLAGLLARLP